LEALAAQGFDPGAADGLWGKKFVAALRAFQRSRGLAPTGIVDKGSFAVLFLQPITTSVSTVPSATGDATAQAPVAVLQPPAALVMAQPPPKAQDETNGSSIKTGHIFLVLFALGVVGYLRSRKRRRHK
jgi:peptidoglycan hydrolase-like protein with peptidoglycan-binding domain